jgi:hypothetical protein
LSSLDRSRRCRYGYATSPLAVVAGWLARFGNEFFDKGLALPVAHQVSMSNRYRFTNRRALRAMNLRQIGE